MIQVQPLSQSTTRPRCGTRGHREFDAIYEAWFSQVVRWLRAMGSPESEVEDLAQEVFIVVRRRLHAFDRRNLPGWLYKIASRQARDLRRGTWFRHLVTSRGGLDPEGLECPDRGGDGERQLERREIQRLLLELLDGMSEKRRTIFVLFEWEGYSGAEIAALLGMPLNTVWTRLYHARRDVLGRVEALRPRPAFPS